MTANADQVARATEIFCEVMGVLPSGISEATCYADLERWDSLRHLELVQRLEEAFAVELDVEDVIAMESLGRIHEILARSAGRR
jgi:acyl carrier protein